MRRARTGRRKGPRKGAENDGGVDVILTEDELVRAVGRDRAAGKTIALANGCFDVLHVGHVRYLQGAAADADRVIVAANDDSSVRALKGDRGPLLPCPDPAALFDR